jgi:hypothetical protein
VLFTNISPVILPDQTQLAACICESYLLVTAAGLASSIADCGEQLAWIASTLRLASENTVAYSVPLLGD